jgi:hypothetical protein
MHPFDADNWMEVESSNLAAVGTRDHYLIVKFKRGNLFYRYANCAHEFDSLVNAKSVGQYFANEIKNNYDFNKLPSEEVGWPEEGLD